MDTRVLSWLPGQALVRLSAFYSLVGDAEANLLLGEDGGRRMEDGEMQGFESDADIETWLMACCEGRIWGSRIACSIKAI